MTLVLLLPLFGLPNGGLFARLPPVVGEEGEGGGGTAPKGAGGGGAPPKGVLPPTVGERGGGTILFIAPKPPGSVDGWKPCPVAAGGVGEIGGFGEELELPPNGNTDVNALKPLLNALTRPPVFLGASCGTDLGGTPNPPPTIGEEAPNVPGEGGDGGIPVNPPLGGKVIPMCGIFIGIFIGIPFILAPIIPFI